MVDSGSKITQTCSAPFQEERVEALFQLGGPDASPGRICKMACTDPSLFNCSSLIVWPCERRRQEGSQPPIHIRPVVLSLSRRFRVWCDQSPIMENHSHAWFSVVTPGTMMGATGSNFSSAPAKGWLLLPLSSLSRSSCPAEIFGSKWGTVTGRSSVSLRESDPFFDEPKYLRIHCSKYNFSLDLNSNFHLNSYWTQKIQDPKDIPLL